MKPKFEPRVLLLASLAVLALALVLVAVFTFVSHRGGEAGANATASVQENVTGSQAPVRCFVQGALAGEMSFQDCAARGGSAAQLEAKVEPVPPSAPLRDPADAAAIRADAAAEGAAPVSEAPISGVARSGQCLRFAPDGWRGYGTSVSLSACVRVLFQGRCALPGQAFYGRWADKTLRLTPGRVEISDDNAHFRTLIDQDGQDCSFPAM